MKKIHLNNIWRKTKNIGNKLIHNKSLNRKHLNSKEAHSSAIILTVAQKYMTKTISKMILKKVASALTPQPKEALSNQVRVAHPTDTIMEPLENQAIKSLMKRSVRRESINKVNKTFQAAVRASLAVLMYHKSLTKIT